MVPANGISLCFDNRPQLRDQLIPSVVGVRDLARGTTNLLRLGTLRKAIAAIDVDDVLHVYESVRRVLVKIGNHRAADFHRRVHRGVVRAQPLFEKRGEEGAVDEMVEDGGVGQVSHE